MDGPFPLEKITHCIVCGCDNQRLLFHGADDRYEYPGFFPIMECAECGLAYLGTRVAGNFVGQLYENYYRTISKVQGYFQASSGWKAKLKESSIINSLYYFLLNPRINLYRSLRLRTGIRVLDVGSGFIPSEAQRIVSKGLQWLTVEVDQEICRSLESVGLRTFCGSLEEFFETGPQAFDYIILSNIIEHIYEPRHFLNIARKLLAPGGEILLVCPNYDSFLKQQYGQKWLHYHVPYHVAHYNPSTLSKLAENAGLHITRLYTTTPFAWYYAQVQLGKGLPYDNRWFGKFPWEKRLLDVRLAAVHRRHQGDSLVAHLKVNSTS